MRLLLKFQNQNWMTDLKNVKKKSLCRHINWRSEGLIRCVKCWTQQMNTLGFFSRLDAKETMEPRGGTIPVLGRWRLEDPMFKAIQGCVELISEEEEEEKEKKKKRELMVMVN